STEVTLLDAGHTAFAMSLPLGTVRLLDTFLQGAGSVERARMRLVTEAIDRALDEALPELRKFGFDVVVGTGGNVETLAELCPVGSTGGGGGAPPRAIAVGAMKSLLPRLCEMTPAERREAYNLRPDRADTIVPAAAIFLRSAEVFRTQHILVPGAGLKEGIL